MSVGRKIWRVVYPALLLFGAYLAVYLLAIMAAGSFFASKYDSVDSFMAAAGNIVSIIALMAGGVLVWLFYRKDYVIPSRKLFESPKYIVSIALVGILAGHGLTILVSLINLTGILGTYTQITTMLSASGVLITIFKSVILAPIAEEITFRGLVFRRMEEYTSFWPAALISALLFALYHFNLVQGIYAFLYGILLCLIYRIFRNLWATVIMHALANLFAVIMQVTGLDYPNIAVYMIVCAATLAASAVLYFTVLRKAENVV